MNSLLSAPVQKIAQFLIRRVLGAYIKPHSLRSDQVEVQLLNGELRLTDVEIEPAAVNPFLANHRVALLSGTISRLRIAIPVRRLLSEKTRVFIEGVRLEVAPLPCDGGRDQDEGATGGFGASETLAVLKRLLTQILLNIEVFVDDISVSSILRVKSGIFPVRISVKEGLALSPTTLHKAMYINELTVEIADHTLLAVSSAKCTVALESEQPDVQISVPSVEVQIRSPDQMAVLDQLLHMDEMLDDSAMFQSFVSEAPATPTETSVFWYEDADEDHVLSSLKEKSIEVLTADASPNFHLPTVTPLFDLSVGVVNVTVAVDQIDDQELHVELRDLKLTNEQLQFGNLSAAVVTLAAMQIPVSAPAGEVPLPHMFLSAMDPIQNLSSSSPISGRHTPSCASAVSSPSGGLSTPGGSSSLQTVRSLPEGLDEPPGVHDLEEPFFKGTLGELLPAGIILGAERRGILETSFLIESLANVCVGNNQVVIPSDVRVVLEASDLAFIVAIVGNLTSQLNARELNSSSALEQILLPFSLDVRGTLHVILKCDQIRVLLQCPSVFVENDSLQLRDVSFSSKSIQAKVISVRFAKQTLPSVRHATNIMRSSSSTDPSESIDGWTEIMGKGQRRKQLIEQATPKKNVVSLTTVKSRLHEAACFQVSITSPLVTINCSGLDLVKLQIDLSTFADRLGAASIFYGQRLPTPARWSIASPVKVAVNVAVHEARLSDLVMIRDVAVRVVSFIEPQIGPLTQLGVSIRQLFLMNNNTPINKVKPEASQTNGEEIRSRFDCFALANAPLNENVRLFLTPQPRKGQGINSFVTLVHSIEIGGLEFTVDPEVINSYVTGKLIPFFALSEVPLLPKPAQLSAKAFTMYKLHVHDITLFLHSDLSVTVRGVESASGSSYQFEGGPPVKLSGFSFKMATLELWLSKPGAAGHVRVGELHGICGTVKMKEEITELDLKMEKAAAEVCADSLYRLKSVLESVQSNFQSLGVNSVPAHGVETFQRFAPTHTKFPTVNPSSAPFTLDVDEDFVRSLAPSLGRGESSSSGRTAQRQQRAQTDLSRGIVTEARWLVDPNTVSVMHDHVTAKTLPGERQRTIKTLRAVSGVVAAVPIVLRTTVTFDHAAVRIFDGDDWSTGEDSRAQSRTVRSKKNSVGLEIGNGVVVVQRGISQAESDHPCSVLSGNFQFGTVDIRDNVVASVYQFILSRLDATQDTTSPQLSGNFVFCSDAELHEAVTLDVIIAPLCVTVDQDAAEFISRFLERFTALDYLEDSESSSMPSGGDQTETSLNDLLIASFTMCAIEMELNYRAKRVSMAGLRRGDPLEYLNLLPVLEGLQLRLSDLRLADVGSVSELLRRVSTTWMGDLNKSQIVKSLSTLTPIRSLKNIFSQGLGQLITQPVAQMRRRDGRVSKGIVKGVHSFLRTLLVESLALADVAVSGAHAALTSADAVFQSRSLQSPPATVQVQWEEEEEDATLEWTPVERGATGQRPYLPYSTVETLEITSTALLRGIFSGIQGVRQDDGGSSVLSVARGLPQFVLRPALGATEAISVAVRSARGAVDATRQKEQSRRYKAPFVRGSAILELFCQRPQSKTTGKSVAGALKPLNLAEAEKLFYASPSKSPVLVYGSDVSAVFLKNSAVCFSLETLAERILTQPETGDVDSIEPTSSGRDLLEAMKTYVAELGVDSRVVFRASSSSSLALANVVKPGSGASDRRLVVNYNPDACIPRSLVAGVCAHEIGTHLLRMLNDNLQVWCGSSRKSYRLSPHMATEEGLATLNTLVASNELSLRHSALNYWAVCQGARMSFSALFACLAPFLPDPTRRFRLCVRVKRGLVDTAKHGACTLDQNYFRGAVDLLRNLEHTDMRLLYCGQIARRDLLDSRLRNVLTMHQTILPPFLRCSTATKDYMKRLVQIRQFNGIDM